MKKIIALFLLCSFAGLAQLSPQEKKEGFKPLFNGKNLDGWVPKFSGFPLGVNYNDTFRVENGVFKVSYDKWTDFGTPPHPILY